MAFLRSWGLLIACGLFAVASIGFYLTRQSQADAYYSENSLSADDWADVKDGPLRVGADGVPVRVVMFSDYQCGYCDLGSKSLDSLVARRDDVAFVSRSFTARSGPGIVAASKAAHCAGQQGVFPSANQALYEGGMSMHLLTGTDMAEAVGAPDVDAFQACFQAPETAQAVADDTALGREHGVAAVPTYFIDGVRVEGTLTAAGLESALDAR